MNVKSVVTDFDDVAGEAQGILGDSGGGVFNLNTAGTPSPLDDYWELAGSIVTVGTFSGQPGNTAVYGNATYAVDISQYRTAILNTIPEPQIALLVLIGSSLLAIRKRTRAPAG